MYARQPPHGFARPMRVPQNYSGNAFSQKEEPPPEPIPVEEDPTSEKESESVPTEESTPVGSLSHPFSSLLGPGKLFGRSHSGGIGSEELLLLGLIFLISQNHSGDDLLLLLILLLLIG